MSKIRGPTVRGRARTRLVVVAALLASTLVGGPVGTAAAAPGDDVVATRVLAVAGPVTLVAPPGDARRFVATLGGRVVLLRPDGRSSTFLDLSSRVSTGGERGLLGLAFSPTYAEDGRFWVAYTDTAGDSVVARYEVGEGTPGRADPDSHTVVLRVDQPYGNHNGGMLAFADDGMLLVGLGDGGGSGDPDGNGQDTSTLLGSVLRLDVVDRAGTGYRVPDSNPLVGRPGRDEIWASGVRNPWRFSTDRATGDVWIADVGQGAVEEVDRLAYVPSRAHDLGWNRFEGSRCFAGPCGIRTGLTFPVTEYGHDEGASVTGGYVSRAASTPSLYGQYVFGDFVGGWYRAFDPATGAVTSLDLGIGAPIGFGEDDAGELYALTFDGVHALRGPGSGTAFSDVDASGVFADAIGALVDADVTDGCDPRVEHRFCPTGTVTRAQMAAFVAAAAGFEDAEEPFDDVDDGGPFAGPIGALADRGIVAGCSGGDFCPSEPVTRAQVAVLLAAALGLDDAAAPFDDVAAGSPFSGAIGALAAAGVTDGCAPRAYCPTVTVTRGTMAALVADAFGL